METREIGTKLVELCKQGKNMEAINSFYSPDIVSVEAAGPPGMELESKGIDAVRAKNKWWSDNNEVHSASAQGPFVNGENFAVIFNYDITSNMGPQSGKRTKMEEVAVYTVENGKIVHEKFLY